jgi:hypothetical protein
MNSNRRQVLSAIAASGAAVALNACGAPGGKQHHQAQQALSPTATEDLMREHSILRRWRSSQEIARESYCNAA